MRDVMAFDRGSVRSFDQDGRLHVLKSHISKANVSPYYGKEIPNYQTLGLEPDKIYQLYRDPVELELGASTAARLQILRKHELVSVDEPKPDLVVGSIGSNVEFNAPYLDADLCFFDKTAIAGIETGQVIELSCAYRYDADMTAGTINGVAYDGVMRNIRFNHLALVDVGRAGSDVLVADKKPSFFMETSMTMTKLGKALFASFSAASKVLAADSALPALVGQADRKTFDKPKVKTALLAMDADMDSEQVDNVLDAMLDVEQEPKAQEPMAAADESPADKIKSMLDGKVDPAIIEQIFAMLAPAAMDEEAEPKEEKDKGMKEEDVKTAMDALAVTIRKEMRDAEQAKRDVRDVVGDVIGMVSAFEVYGFALDQMKVDRKDVESLPALRAIFKAASTKSQDRAPALAQDSGEAVKLFPNISRIKTI